MDDKMAFNRECMLFSKLYKIMVNKATFIGVRVVITPPGSALRYIYMGVSFRLFALHIMGVSGGVVAQERMGTAFPHLFHVSH